MLAERYTGTVADLTAISAIESHGAVTHRPVYAAAKRGFDIVFAILLIVVLSPLWITTAFLVAYSSPGPILYRQTRVGKNGRTFTCYKFRTMVPNAHVMKVQYAPLNETTGPVFKIRSDPRVTKVGRWLRKFSIDELPQLINVIRGEMSIVGPRPPLPEEVARYTDYQLGRLSVIPGLTCVWQVSGRSNLGFDEWVEKDMEYIRRRSFWFDIKLILLTIPAVITARGAY